MIEENYLCDAMRDCWIRILASALSPATRHARCPSRVYVFSDVLEGARSFETTLLSAARTIPSPAFRPASVQYSHSNDFMKVGSNEAAELAVRQHVLLMQMSTIISKLVFVLVKLELFFENFLVS